MSDCADSDYYPELDFPDLTAEDFAEIDAQVAIKIAFSAKAQSRANSEARKAENFDIAEKSSQSDKDGANLSLLTSQQPSELNARIKDVEDGCVDMSFRSDDFDLDLFSLTAEEFEKLDESVASTSRNGSRAADPPVVIEIEDYENKEKLYLPKHKYPVSPLAQFRSNMVLSVTDLVSPSWCEVKYDYGLRGQKSRPIYKRPTSFVSASGKVISPEVSVAQKNDIQTKQGLAVHKELEREMRFEELGIEITTDETRWALRLFNMIACLKGIVQGVTREMPVFGILHGEVIVGIIDELIRLEVRINGSPTKKATKRPLGKHLSPTSKRSRTSPSSFPSHLEALSESPQKPLVSMSDSRSGRKKAEKVTEYKLQLKDCKTRQNPYLPSEPDMYSGKLQLMVYRKLLGELISTNPPYDFKPLWSKLEVDSSAIFPTKFLVQARLTEEDSSFQTCCLDDMVVLWQRTVQECQIIGVDDSLELVYRLRPPPDFKEKRRTKIGRPSGEVYLNRDVDSDLQTAIAASLKESESAKAGEQELSNWIDAEKEENVRPFETLTDLTLSNVDSEEIQLQWALHASTSITTPSANDISMISYNSSEFTSDPAPEEGGIHQFKIIGTKKFFYDENMLEEHLAHVLEWWRGHRMPEGVPLERAYRCVTCEYANDCEWRAEKAVEFSKKKK